MSVEKIDIYPISSLMDPEGTYGATRMLLASTFSYTTSGEETHCLNIIDYDTNTVMRGSQFYVYEEGGSNGGYSFSIISNRYESIVSHDNTDRNFYPNYIKCNKLALGWETLYSYQSYAFTQSYLDRYLVGFSPMNKNDGYLVIRDSLENTMTKHSYVILDGVKSLVASTTTGYASHGSIRMDVSGFNDRILYRRPINGKLYLSEKNTSLNKDSIRFNSINIPSNITGYAYPFNGDNSIWMAGRDSNYNRYIIEINKSTLDVTLHSTGLIDSWGFFVIQSGNKLYHVPEYSSNETAGKARIYNLNDWSYTTLSYDKYRPDRSMHFPIWNYDLDKLES